MRVSTDENGNVVLDCESGEPFGPVEADLGTAQPGRHRQPARLGRADHGEPGAWERSRCGRSTTSPPTPTRSTSTRSPSRSSTASRSATAPPRPPESWEAGRKDTVIAYPERDHAREGALRPPRAVRLALPHPRARGQRDDAALPHRPLTPGAVRGEYRVKDRGLLDSSRCRRTLGGTRCGTRRRATWETRGRRNGRRLAVDPGFRCGVPSNIRRAACRQSGTTT